MNILALRAYASRVVEQQRRFGVAHQLVASRASVLSGTVTLAIEAAPAEFRVVVAMLNYLDQTYVLFQKPFASK
jgi:hypothetical protein